MDAVGASDGGFDQFIVPAGRPHVELDVLGVVASTQEISMKPVRRLVSLRGLSLIIAPLLMWTFMLWLISVLPLGYNGHGWLFNYALPFMAVLSAVLAFGWVFHVRRLHKRGPLLIADLSRGELFVPRSNLGLKLSETRAIRVSRGKIRPSPGTTHEFGSRRISQLIVEHSAGGVSAMTLVVTVIQSDRRLRRAAKEFASLVGKPYIESELPWERCPKFKEVSQAFRLTF